MDRDKELKNCTPIKAILMLIIVIYHSMRVYAEGTWGPYIPMQEAPILGYTSDWLNSFHVYAFTVISGYIFCFIKYEKSGYQNYKAFIGNKIKRLLVPYVFVAAIWVAPIHAYFFGTEGLVEKYLLGMSPSQLWFLLMLFWAFLIFWPLYDIVYRKPLFGGAIIGALYCIGLFMPSIYCFNSGLTYLLFFYIGFIIRKFDFINRALYRTPSFIYLMIDIGLFAICVTMRSETNDIIFKIITLACTIMLNVIGAVGAFVILQRFVTRFLQGSRTIDFLGEHSMTVFLFHQQLIYFSIGLLNGVVPPIILVVINFGFSLSISIVISVLLHKTKITRMLIGYK